MWIKENLINIALSKTPKTAKYIAWLDADIVFHKNKSNFSSEIIKSL